MLKVAELSKFWATFVVILILFCSSQEKNQTEKTAELTFDVDSTKLEKTTFVHDIGVQFNAPKEWTRISTSLFEEFSKHSSMILLEGNDFAVNPISIFLNKENNNVLFLSQLEVFEDSTIVNKYKDLIQIKFSPTKVGNFIKDDIIFTQYLIQDENRINFKLLFFNSKNQLIQFDYIISRESYLSEIKAIESSIGSIKLIE